MGGADSSASGEAEAEGDGEPSAPSEEGDPVYAVAGVAQAGWEGACFMPSTIARAVTAWV